ncbi:MAG: hypothetical protein LAN59_02295 [Acidobacteriia bacterium]|nr:hypothetical protein [Terriglobia bacterium]
MLPGLLALVQGKLEYQDHRGLVVFAPFGLLVGVVLIVLAIRVGRAR